VAGCNGFIEWWAGRGRLRRQVQSYEHGEDWFWAGDYARGPTMAASRGTTRRPTGPKAGRCRSRGLGAIPARVGRGKASTALSVERGIRLGEWNGANI
jgi:hypothetical protein